MSNFISIEKEVYEAVLRNSLRVNDLEKENAQLKIECQEREKICHEMKDIILKKIQEISRVKKQLEDVLNAIQKMEKRNDNI